MQYIAQNTDPARPVAFARTPVFRAAVAMYTFARGALWGRKGASFCCIALAASACSSPTHSALPQTAGSLRVSGAPASDSRDHTSPIQHVIVVVQENRTLDNMFYGFPGVNYAKYGEGHGKRYPLEPIPLKWKFGPNHSHAQFLEDYDRGKLDGFDNMIWYVTAKGSRCSDGENHPICWIFYTQEKIKKMAFSYVKKDDIQPYWTMASEYGINDNTFSSNSDGSFVAHQYLIAGQSGHTSGQPTGSPWGCDADKSVYVTYSLVYGKAKPPVFSAETGHEIPGPFPCFTYETIADELDAASVSWRYYVAGRVNGFWNGFDAIKPIRYGPDWQNMAINTSIFDDIKNGNLAQVSWVTPAGPYSDHAGPGTGNGGPDWVASIVNAVGQSKYWNSSAIIVTWDDWGGWYDHVKPPQLPDPVTGAYEGLGFRVPLIIVSPYAKAHHVSHTQFETASTLHFIEDTFGLSSLGLADAREGGFGDMFDYKQKPISFKPIPSVLNAMYFTQHPSSLPPDDY